MCARRGQESGWFLRGWLVRQVLVCARWLGGSPTTWLLPVLSVGRGVEVLSDPVDEVLDAGLGHSVKYPSI